MSRELNRDLFEELQPSTSRARAKSAEPAKDAARPVIATTEDLKVISFQVEAMAKKMNEFESKVEVLGSKWDEFASSSKLRYERIQGNFQRQSEAMQSTFRDIYAKIAAVASRVNERKMSDAGIAEMVERNERAIQSLEARIHQLQKTIGEQELELINSRSELRDVLKEMSKLRRG